MGKKHRIQNRKVIVILSAAKDLDHAE